MTWNSVIAIVFSLIFLGKFLLMDSRILLAVTDAGTVTYVNPFCEKRQVKVHGEVFGEFVKKDSRSFSLSLDSFCNASYKFEAFHWESLFIPEETREYSHHRFYLPESARDRFYPPPRV